MRKTVSVTVLLVPVIVFSIAVALRAQSKREVTPRKVKQTAAPAESKHKTEPKQVIPTSPGTSQSTIPQRPFSVRVRQEYRMVTDVLDGFGGASESDNYSIPNNSGGQPSPPGSSESTSWGVAAGYVFTSRAKHGDSNADETIDLGDAIYILNYLFKGGPDPCPMEAGDANSNGAVDLGDAIYVLNYLFKGGPAPAC